ncbi:MAG: Type II secretion system protein E [uncultured bacterium]|nr:MAG: Type II secretion system protein E [uncultured bacterium]
MYNNITEKINESDLFISYLAPELIQRYRIIPLKKENQTLYIGISDLTRIEIFSNIAFQTGLNIKPIYVNEKEIENWIKNNIDETTFYHQFETTLSQVAIRESSPSNDEIVNHDEPIINFVDQLLEEAIHQHVSDIHIESFENTCRIRFRHDGILQENISIPIHLAQRIMSRLKIMANLNITEKRIPQDGKIHFKKQGKIDIRINICPTLFGEKAVLRLFNSDHASLGINTLGMSKQQEEIFLQALSQPQGLILVTGPTGSGKTTTLYSALNHLNKIEKNISTVEDPVEIELPGVNQVNINPSIGLDFTMILRALLRQDPDVIMIGEIRDKETATIAIQAAQTGHLVLSTLHTNDAIHSIIRLRALGISVENILNSIHLVIAQRLLRMICQHCQALSLPQYSLNSALHCNQCYHGYQGRTGVFELLPIPTSLINMTANLTNITQFIYELTKYKLSSLRESGLEKVHIGITNNAELTRVFGIEAYK